MISYLGDILHNLQVDLSQRKGQFHLDTANQGTQSRVQSQHMSYLNVNIIFMLTNKILQHKFDIKTLII